MGFDNVLQGHGQEVFDDVGRVSHQQTEQEGTYRIGIVGFYDAEPDGAHEAQQGDDLTWGPLAQLRQLIPHFINGSRITACVCHHHQQTHNQGYEDDNA